MKRSLPYLDKLLVLITIGMPGLQRLLLVWIVKETLGLEMLGLLNNDLSLVQLFAFFTAVGWCSLIMVRLPLSQAGDRSATVASIVRASLPAQALGLVVLIASWKLGFILHLWGSIALSVGWNGYQFLRHVQLALKRYRDVLILDTAITVAMLVLLLPGVRPGLDLAYLAIAGPMVLATGVGLFYMFLQSGAWQVMWIRPETGLARKGLEFGAGNFFSGGLLMLLAPLILRCAGPAYAGLYGLISSFLNILAMAPRALALYYLPDLSRSLQEGKERVSSLLCHYRNRLLAALALMSVVVAVGWILGHSLLLMPEQQLEGLHFIFLLMLVNLILSQGALPEANLLMVREETRVLLGLNATILTLFVAGSLPIALAWKHTPGNVLALLFVQVLLTLGRWLVQARQARLFFQVSSC